MNAWPVAISIVVSLLAFNPVSSGEKPGDALRADALKGLKTFRSRCSNCHGVNADGVSRVAKILRPRPSNLRRSELDVADMRRIIELGGLVAFGRSANMPAWGALLSKTEIDNIIFYLQGLDPGEGK